jgi:hypothetical protein
VSKFAVAGEIFYPRMVAGPGQKLRKSALPRPVHTPIYN